MRVKLLSTLLAIAPLCAQEHATPAKELASFDKFIGVWEGKGTSISEPNGKPMAWKATARYEKVLDGFFVREQVHVDFAPAIPQPLLIENIFGWDAENQRYVGLSVSNLGLAKQPTIAWDGGKLILTNSGAFKGKGYVTREVIDVTGDRYTFKIERGEGAAPMFTHVDGTLERSKVAEASAAAKPADVAFAENYGADEIAKLNAWVGKWKVTGTMIPGPGIPEQKISGTETISKLWGGQLLVSKITSDPADGPVYLGCNYLAWNPDKRCYESFMFDNMGQICTAEMRVDGDNVIMTGAQKAMGVPTATRSVIEMKNGALVKIWADALSGTGAVQRVFQGTYEKAM